MPVFKAVSSCSLPFGRGTSDLLTQGPKKLPGTAWDNMFTHSKPQGPVCWAIHWGCNSLWLFLQALFHRDYFYFVPLFYFFNISKYRLASVQSRSQVHMDVFQLDPVLKYSVKFRDTDANSLRLK